MTSFIVINSTNAQLTNINAGGIDVPANSVRTATLDATELDTLLSGNAGVACVLATATYEQRRKIAATMKYRKTATGAQL